MPDIVVFTQARGLERVWVPESEVDWWISFYERGGSPALRWTDYQARRGLLPTDRNRRVMLHWGAGPS